MAEQISPYALTTLARVKDLLFDPSLTINVSATVTKDSAALSNVIIPTGKTVRIGQTISGPTIPSGTTITALSAGAMTLSQNATAAGTGVALYVVDQPVAFDIVLTRMINWATNYINNECGRTSFVQQSFVNDTYSISNSSQQVLILRNFPVYSISSFQYRAGTPTNPAWTDFIPDQYELINPRTDPITGNVWYPSGMLRVYGPMPGIYNNQIRASYVGGYPVDWANAEDGNTHLLPGDITSVCENLVVRRFKRRQLAGQNSMSLEGASTQGWRDKLDAEDLAALGQYKDLHF
jgi:hypothetical protein